MALVSGFEKLAPGHRAWLLNRWRRNGYSDHERTAAALAARLRDDPEHTDPPPDTSTVWRWARKQHARAEQIRYSAELTAATIAALPDNDPALTAKVGAFLEGRIVEAVQEIEASEELPAAERLAVFTAAQSANTQRRRADTAAETARLARERWESEQAIRREERAKAAGAAETAARAAGISPAGISALRAAIEGAL